MKRPLRSVALACLLATLGLLSACGGGGGGCSSILLGSLGGSSCGSGTSSAGTGNPSAKVNQIPLAKTSGITSVVTGGLVTLNGSESSDADGDALTYEWTFVSRPDGSGAALENSRTPRPSFTADRDGSYVLSLRVHDGKAFSDTAYLTVSASRANLAPVAAILAPALAVVSAPVVLDATNSFDPNRDELRYAWSLVSKPAGSSADLSSRVEPKPSFTPDLQGTYVFSLQVSDGRLSSALEYTTINAGAANLRPDAVVSPNLVNVVRGTKATLDGTSSSDPNRDALKYRWEFVSKPTSSRADDTLTKESALAQFIADFSGVYVLSLTVSDGQLESKPQYVTVIASEGNTAPSAIINADRQVLPGSIVTLDGSSSTDPNRDPINYIWALVSRPTDSKAALTSRSAPKPSFVADKPGLYVVSLQVYDGKLYSETAVVAISANINNNSPTARIKPVPEVKTGGTVTLNGLDSTDPDNDLLEYRWSILTFPGTNRPAISTDKSPIAQFVPATPGIYVVRLAVFDGKVESAPVYVTVTATSDNLKPEANPGTYGTLRPGATLRLNGNLSSDPDKNLPLKYEWKLVSQPPGSTATLQGALTESPILVPDAVGAWVVGLVVIDALGLKSDEATTVVAVDTGPIPPKAIARLIGSETPPVNSPIQLDGSDSFTGDPIQYEWGVVFMPTGSTVKDDLEKVKTVAKPIIILDKTGTYVFSLVVRVGGATSEKVLLLVKAI